MYSRQSGLPFWGSTENFHFETWRCPLWTLYTIKHFRKMENAWTGERGPCRISLADLMVIQGTGNNWAGEENGGTHAKYRAAGGRVFIENKTKGRLFYLQYNCWFLFYCSISSLKRFIISSHIMKNSYTVCMYEVRHCKPLHCVLIWHLEYCYVLYIGGCCPCTALPYIPNSEVLRTNNSFEGDSLEGK